MELLAEVIVILIAALMPIVLAAILLFYPREEEGSEDSVPGETRNPDEAEPDTTPEMTPTPSDKPAEIPEITETPIAEPDETDMGIFEKFLLTVKSNDIIPCDIACDNLFAAHLCWSDLLNSREEIIV